MCQKKLKFQETLNDFRRVSHEVISCKSEQNKGISRSSVKKMATLDIHSWKEVCGALDDDIVLLFSKPIKFNGLNGGKLDLGCFCTTELTLPSSYYRNFRSMFSSITLVIGQ